jgi:hypothetical protein
MLEAVRECEKALYFRDPEPAVLPVEVPDVGAWLSLIVGDGRSGSSLSRNDQNRLRHLK